jgi:hypothetical protein
MEPGSTTGDPIGIVRKEMGAGFAEPWASRNAGWKKSPKQRSNAKHCRRKSIKFFFIDIILLTSVIL